ncbi:hypothetical protein YC2023_097897 [Brassica napus]
MFTFQLPNPTQSFWMNKIVNIRSINAISFRDCTVFHRQEDGVLHNSSISLPIF